MQVIAMMANRKRTRVLPRMPNIRAKPSPRRSPARMAARKQPVPVAVSQLKSKRAASGVGLAATGIVRETFPLEPRPVPARWTGAWPAIGHNYFERRSRGFVESVLDRGKSPAENEDRQDQ